MHWWSNPPLACRRSILSTYAARDSGHRRGDGIRSSFSTPTTTTTAHGRARRGPIASAPGAADVDLSSSSPYSLSHIATTRPIVLAHMNFAKLIAPMDDPRIVEFANAMGPINEIARSTPGFVWSLDDDDDVDDDGNDKNYDRPDDDEGRVRSARSQRMDVKCLRDDPLLFPQLSLWHDVDSIRHFAYKSGHAMYFRRRKEWFVPHPEGTIYSVCWWHRLAVTNGGRGRGAARPPTLSEAFDRCEYLRSNGPTAFAFDFATHARFPMPSSSTSFTLPSVG